MKTRVVLACQTILALAFVFLPVHAWAADNWVEVRTAHFVVNSNGGEKEAKKIADQFEEIRRMFHGALGTLRVDPGQPIIIIAAKNENTMKLFLPEEWEVKGHIHHAGLYQPGEDRDYVVMRLDSEGPNPFHTLYHEYTHALLRLNFTGLPLWLNEGLAEFYGNSTLGDKESKTGTIDPGHLYLLQQSKLIPIEALLEVDRHSPYYNESNRASVFYAESWVLVHYLLMDKDARQDQLLKNFLVAWQKSGNQLQAAQEAFGDLRQFGKRIEAYARQTSFTIGLVKAVPDGAAKNYSARSVSPGEVLALRGDFFAHHNDLERAQPVLQEAAQAEPNLPFAHEALGYYSYRRRELAEADAEMVQALKLGTTSFAPQYFHGKLLVEEGRLDEKTAEEAERSLEKAVQLNPQFAPAYEALAQTYSRLPNSHKQAVNAAIRAVELDPGQHAYAINLIYLLMNSGRFSEARIMAQRLQAAASSPAEKEVARNLLVNIQQAEEWSVKKPSPESASVTATDSPAADSTMTATIASNSAQKSAETPAPQTSPEGPSHLHSRRLGVDGSIGDADCSLRPELFLNLNLASGPVTFHASDSAKVSLQWAADATKPSVNTCSAWKGRHVKVWFIATPGKQYAGEIVELYFY